MKNIINVVTSNKPTANLDEAVTIFLNHVGSDVLCFIDRNIGTITSYDYDELDEAYCHPDLIRLPYEEELTESCGNIYNLYFDKYHLLPNDHEKPAAFLHRIGCYEDYQYFKEDILKEQMRCWLESEGFELV